MLDYSSWVPLLAAADAHGGGHGEPKAPLPTMGILALYYGAAMALIAIVFYVIARGGYDIRGPKTWPAKLAEHVYLFLEKIAVSVIGAHGRQFIPFLAALWSVIFVSNVFGLVAHVSPTANMSFNLGLSVLTVLYVQWAGIKANGFFGHLKHFAGPKLPANLIAVSGLIFVVELLSEAAKILSLALRLFGNIAGGKLVVKNLDEIGINAIPEFVYHLPIGSFLIPIKLLTAIIQPFVWVMLTCVYLGLVTHHDHDHVHVHEHEDHEHDHDHKPVAQPA